MTQQQIVTPLNKISVSTVYGKLPVKAIKEDGQDKVRLENPVAIMRLLGQASGYEAKQSQYGESLAFNGVFRATNMDTGEVFESAKCFLPNVVEGLLGEALGDNDVVEFAFEVAAIPAKNAHGYEYRVKPLLPTTPAPIFAQLEEKIAKVPQLAAPAAKAEKPEAGKKK